MSLRAQWCALELASMATTQPAGRRTHQSMNRARGKARLVSTCPVASTACTWITRLARSTPTRTASSRITLSTDFPLQWLQIDDFEHHQSWRLDAVARRWEVPSHSDRVRGAPCCCEASKLRATAGHRPVSRVRAPQAIHALMMRTQCRLSEQPRHLSAARLSNSAQGSGRSATAVRTTASKTVTGVESSVISR